MDMVAAHHEALDITRARRAPASLDALLADAFHRSPIASTLLSGGGVVTEANDAMARLLGRRRDDLAGRTLRDLIHPDDVADHDELAVRLDDGQIDGFTLELRLAHAEWTWVWVELHVSMVRDEHGVRRWGIAHLIDLTERRLAEAEVQQFFELAEASLDFVSLFDLDGTVRFVNRAGKALVGLDLDTDAHVLRLADFLPTDALDRLLREIRSSVERQGHWQGATRFRHFRTGTEIPVQASITRLSDLDGSGFSLGFVARDVTEQNRAAKALAEGEARLSTLLANTADIVAMTDHRGVLTFANEAVRTQLGYDPDAVQGRPFTDLVHPDDVPLVTEALGGGLAASGREGHRLEARLRHANGEWRWFDVFTSAQVEARNLQGVVLNLRDATERREVVEDNNRRALLSQLALWISRQALDVGLADFVQALPLLLRKIGELLDVGICYVDRLHLAENRIEPIANWLPPMRVPRASGLPTDLRELPEWLDVLSRHQPIVAEDLQRERPAWYVEKEEFTRLGTRAAVICPLVAGGRLVGVLGVETANRSRRWRAEEVTFVQTVGEAIANALARQEAQDDLRASEERFRLLAEYATDLILRYDRNGLVLYASRASHSLLGYAPEEMEGRYLAEFIHADDQLEARVHRDATMAGDTPRNLTVRLRRNDGTYVWTETTTMPVKDKADAIVELQSSTRDITDRKQREDELTRQALIDPLTGLANRVLLLERMAAADRQRQRNDQPFSVLLIDLDGFKEINDTYGHPVGDEVLATLANRISGLVRQTDTVARLGGDEFVVLTTNSEPDMAMGVAERVVEVVSQPLAMPDGLSAIGASVGVAHARGPHVDLEGLLRQADEAMYRAKRAGKGRVREALR